MTVCARARPGPTQVTLLRRRGKLFEYDNRPELGQAAIARDWG